jgi:hypothetical protein
MSSPPDRLDVERWINEGVRDGLRSPPVNAPSRLTGSSPSRAWSAAAAWRYLRSRWVHPDDAHGRLAGLDGVFAAGDATAFPIKHGGLAAQQADVVAEAIAASVGVDSIRSPVRPILRGVLLTGGPPRYLRAEISTNADDDSVISQRPPWWPPDKISGRYLAPYLSSQVGDAADVMPQGDHVTPVGTPARPDRGEHASQLRRAFRPTTALSSRHAVACQASGRRLHGTLRVGGRLPGSDLIAFAKEPPVVMKPCGSGEGARFSTGVRM